MRLRFFDRLTLTLAGVFALVACHNTSTSATCTADNGPTLDVTGRSDGIYGVVDDHVDNEPLVPASLMRLTETGVDSQSSKQWLRVAVPEETARPMLDFTQSPTGKSIAVVLNGELASRHKIRQPLTSGSIQVNCCDPKACERWKALLKSAARVPSAATSATQ